MLAQDRQDGALFDKERWNNLLGLFGADWIAAVSIVVIAVAVVLAVVLVTRTF